MAGHERRHALVLGLGHRELGVRLGERGARRDHFRSARPGGNVVVLRGRALGLGRLRRERRRHLAPVEHRERVAGAHRVAFVHREPRHAAADERRDVDLVQLDRAAAAHAGGPSARPEGSGGAERGHGERDAKQHATARPATIDADRGGAAGKLGMDQRPPPQSQRRNATTTRPTMPADTSGSGGA